MRELYVREPEDDYYKDGIIEVSDDLSAYLMQLEMLLFTKQYTVMGDEDFGIDLEGMIYEHRLNEYEIERVILNQIAKYCPSYSQKFKTRAYVSFIRGDLRDIAVVDINIDGRSYFGLVSK
jgi:hypothetical protein